VGDDRDNQTWAVFELTYAGEKAAQTGHLAGHLRRILPAGTEFFLPYLSYEHLGKTTLFNVMEGYCFVATGPPENLYLKIADESSFFRQVLNTTNGASGLPALLTVPDSKVEELRIQLGEMAAVDIKVDMMVEVQRGICKGLTGKVLTLDEDMAQVLLTMRTLRTIRSIPRWALFPKGDSDE
jgi:hypothetical protein